MNSLISALGGPAVVAQALGTKRTNVANWRTFGAIPPAWYLPLRALCFEREIALDERLFKKTPKRGGCPSAALEAAEKARGEMP